MSSDTTNNNNVVIDNKANNNNHLNDDAAPSTTTNNKDATNTPNHQGDNKAASQVALSSIYSPSPIPSTSASTAYAVAQLRAAALAGEGSKNPIHISVALDVSGSMNGDRINTAKESLKFVVDNLRDKDSLGLVLFNSSVSTALPLTQMTTEGKTKAHRAIDACRAGGSTNLSGGLFAAHSQVTGMAASTPLPAVPDTTSLINNMRSRRPPHPSDPFVIPTAPPALVTTPAAPTSIPVVISFSYDGNGNKPEEKHRYKLTIAPPAADADKITKYTIHDPENRFADILGSGESEYELKPVASPIQQLEITFDLEGGSTHKANYFLGEVASAKRTIQVPLKKQDGPTGPATVQRQNRDDVVRCTMIFTDGFANGVSEACNRKYVRIMRRYAR